MTYKFRFASMTLPVCALVALAGSGSAFGAVDFPAPTVNEALPPVPVVETSIEDGIVPEIVTPLPVPVVRVDAPIMSLAQLVTRHSSVASDERQMNCLATAVYFESKGEPLKGQLAVAEVILNRASSGRFASTICGVVLQRSQFSFVRNGGFPAIVSKAQWRQAVGIAHIAMNKLHAGPAANALFFHARRVSPNWGKRLVASVGNHIFYR